MYVRAVVVVDVVLTKCWYVHWEPDDGHWEGRLTPLGRPLWVGPFVGVLSVFVTVV